MTGKKAVDPRIAAIVAAAPPLTAQQSATIAALGKSIADAGRAGAVEHAPSRQSRRVA